MIEHHSKIETGQLLGVAGFVAIFIGANYLIGDWSNAGFYGRTCHVMLQHFAVYITLAFITFTESHFMRTMLFVVLALPAIATAQNQPTTDLAENALLSVFQRDASNTVCSPRNASLKEMRALFDPYIKGIDLNNQASYLTLSQAVYTAFPCPFSPLRAELKPAVKEELLGNWLFPDASLRLRHGPKSPAWQPPSPNIPHINCEGVMFNETGEYRVAQIRGQFACPTPASMQAMRTFPAVQSWTTLPNGRVKISRTDVPAQFEEWEIYTVKAPFEFFSIKFAVGDLVAYLRRHPGNEIGATTTFRHLQPLK